MNYEFNDDIWIKNRRKQIEVLKPAIAYDYHYRTQCFSRTAKRFTISDHTVRSAVSLYDKGELDQIFSQRQQSFLIIPLDELGNAYAALKELGITCRFAAKDHVFQEQFQSKINQ